jgi:hypothetical protein
VREALHNRERVNPRSGSRLAGDRKQRRRTRAEAGSEGSKDWAVPGFDAGRPPAAVRGSFTAPCHRLGMKLWTSLQAVRTRLPGRAADQHAAWRPQRWQAAQPVGGRDPSAVSARSPRANDRLTFRIRTGFPQPDAVGPRAARRSGSPATGRTDMEFCRCGSEVGHKTFRCKWLRQREKCFEFCR